MASTTVEKPLVLHPAADSLSVSVMCLLALTAVQRSIGFLRKWLFCGWLAPEELGQWDLLFGFLTLAASVAVMGLPGTLLRFVEHFRRRGQLRTYLVWTMVATGLLAGVFTAVLVLFRANLAHLFLGGRELHALVLPVAVALLATVAFNTMTTFFTAMRLQRIRSLLVAAYSMAFTVIGSGLLLCWQPTAISVILAHCASLLLCFCLGTYWIWNSAHLLPPNTSVQRIGAGFVSQVIPFAVALWVTNGLANLFPFVDRYMIVTVLGQDPDSAFALVGQYHVARLVPMFMISLAQMLQATLLPYLSHDWESGDRTKVRDRLESFLRIFGLGSYAAAAIFLAVGPWLIFFLFGDKYQAGLEVLNLTLIHGVFSCLFVLAQTYLWCIEKGWLVNAGLLAALLVNVVLNLVLLPRFGLMGAAVASCAGIMILLVYVIGCCGMIGMRFRIATGIVVLLPLTLLAGPLVGLLVLVGVMFVAVNSNHILTDADKMQAAELFKRIRGLADKKRRDLTMED